MLTKIKAAAQTSLFSNFPHREVLIPPKNKTDLCDEPLSSFTSKPERLSEKSREASSNMHESQCCFPNTLPAQSPLMRAVLHLPHWPQTNAMNHYILWNTDLYNTIRPPSNAIHYTHLSVPHFIRQEIFWLAGAIRRRMDWLITAALIWYCHHATNQWPRMFSCVFQVCFGLNELLANFSLA